MQNIVYNEDCLFGMSLYTDKYFDLAIVDPPYGINAPNMQMGSNPNRNEPGQYPGISAAVKLKGRLNSGGGKLKDRMLNKSNISWDNEKPSESYWKELFRISKHQIIFGGNYFGLPPTRCIICWDKKQPWANFSQWEMAWTSFDKPAALFSHSNRGGNNKDKKIHPTQKPIELYDWIFSKFASKDMKILDTHVGSGSSRIAAYKFGITDFTGFEIDKDYYEAQEKRFLEFI